MLVPLREKLRATPISMWAVVGLIIAASIARFNLYGNPKLSIANHDTITYVEASRVPLFSLEMMSGRRLLSTNLIYKAFVPEEYEITVNGSLATSRRQVQPGFEGVAFFQFFMSILGWGFLAFTFAKQIQNPALRVLGATLILAFAYTPQMADWDSILMSESPTFSFFAIQFGLMIWLAFAIHKDPQAKINWLFILWAVVYFFWTFIKDINLYVALITFGMIAGLLLFSKYRRQKIIFGILAFLLATFTLGMYTSGLGPRPHVQTANLFKDDILPNPLRAEYMQKAGMPEPDTKEYSIWLRENGRSALIKFTLSHPGYPATKLANDFPHAFEEIDQTYFKAPNLEPFRTYLTNIGNGLHPESSTPFLLSFILLGGVIYIAWKTPHESRPWAWLGLWLFTAATFAIVATILADTWAVNRHSLFSTMSYRLMMWMFTIVLLDLAFGKTEQFSTRVKNEVHQG